MRTFYLNKAFYFRALITVFLALGLCALTMILLGKPDTTAKSLVYVIACLVAGPCLFAFIVLLARMFSKTPPLAINAGGLFEKSTGSVSWHNIHSVQGYQRGKIKYLHLGINDVQPLLDQQDITQRRAFQQKLEKDNNHLSIPLNPLKGNPDEIFEAVKSEWKAVTGRE